MATKLTWLGHGTWAIETGGKHVLLDPFIDENPAAPVKAADVEADFILVSHAHFDHVSDVAAIAKRTGATIVGNYEITDWFNKNHGLENAQPMNTGGAIQLPFGSVKLTLAHHSSTFPDGASGGNPGGFLLGLAEGNVYFACDTALFLDMQSIGKAGIELAVLPIGDRFTMGPDDALEAIKLIEPKRVVPAHYNTWPPIEQNAAAWAERVGADTSATPLVIEPGGVIEL